MQRETSLKKSPESLVLTSTKRLARHLGGLALNDWLKHCHEQLKGAPPLLSGFWEQQQWRQCLAEQPNAHLLANQAQAASQLLSAHRLSAEASLAPFDQNFQTFCTWEAAFKQATTSIRNQDLIPLICQHINNIALPPHIILTGFDGYTPAQQRLFKHLSTKITLSEYQPTTEPGDVIRYTFDSKEDELAAMLEWASNHTHERIACVVPTLSQQRDTIATAFALKQLNIQMAAAPALSSYPLIQAFLALLKPLHVYPAADAFRWLKNPWICQDDLPLMLKAEQHFAHHAQLSLTTLADYCQHTSTPLAERLKQLTTFTSLQAALDFWAAHLTNEKDQDLFTAWQETIRAQIDTTQPINSTLLHALSQFTRWQPMATGIEVLGCLDAVGHHFDRLWIMSLDQNQWPSAPRPNPLLPFDLQRQHHFPHATAERENAYAAQLTEQLLQTAPHIIVSHTDQPSGLIAHIPASHITLDAPQYPLQPKPHYPILPVTKPEAIKGGSSLPEYQAQCPFKAFAKTRLKAEAVETITLGLSPAEKGQLTHNMLERLWQTLGSQTKLLNLTEEQRTHIIEQAVGGAIAQFKRQQVRPRPFLALEHERLTQLLAEWLTLEAKRTPFTIHALEKAQQLHHAGLNLTLRVDRIDQLDDGSFAMIDYKTGNTTRIRNWLAEPISQVQLPLYAAFCQITISAIAVAEVRHTQTKFKGIGERGDQIPGVIPYTKLNEPPHSASWLTLKIWWEQAIFILLDGFLAGETTPTPGDACTYCDLWGLCRRSQ